MPELYCVDLAKAYVMQESVRLRTYYEKVGMFCVCPTDIRMRNLWQKLERGKKTSASLAPGSHEHLALRKHVMCARNMGAHVQHTTLEYQRYEKWNKKLDSRAAKKGAKKLVSSNCTKILEKESSN